MREVHFDKKDAVNCEKCGKSFGTVRRLNEHINRICPGLKEAKFEDGVQEDTPKIIIPKHQCDHCHKWYAGAKTLRSHIKRVHEKEINFRCTDCNAGYYAKGDFEKHKVVCNHMEHRNEETARYFDKVLPKDHSLAQKIDVDIQTPIDSEDYCEEDNREASTSGKLSKFEGLDFYKEGQTKTDHVRDIISGDQKIDMDDGNETPKCTTDIGPATTCKAFACTVCPKTFKSEQQLSLHVLHHQVWASILYTNVPLFVAQNNFLAENKRK